MGEGEPYLLRDLARVHRPSPELDMPRVRRLEEVGDDVLQGALVADDTLDNLRRPGM